MNQVPEYTDPYVHNNLQTEIYLGGTGMTTPGDAQKLITQGKRVHKVYYENGNWYVDKNDSKAPTVITTRYDPPFRVRFVKVYRENGQLETEMCMNIVYDTPASEMCSDNFAVGTMHPMWITRLHVGERAFDQGEVCLIG